MYMFMLCLVSKTINLYKRWLLLVSSVGFDYAPRFYTTLLGKTDKIFYETESTENIKGYETGSKINGRSTVEVPSSRHNGRNPKFKYSTVFVD